MHRALIALALLAAAGCTYNDHRTFGATEKWVASDVNYVTKIGGTVFVSIGDAIVAPAELVIDRIQYDTQYHPDHRYLSYAGSRAVARSDMGEGYQFMASIPAILFETLYLPITGTIDLIGVLAFGEDEPEPEFSVGMDDRTDS